MLTLSAEPRSFADWASFTARLSTLLAGACLVLMIIVSQGLPHSNVPLHIGNAACLCALLGMSAFSATAVWRFRAGEKFVSPLLGALLALAIGTLAFIGLFAIGFALSISGALK